MGGQAKLGRRKEIERRHWQMARLVALAVYGDLSSEMCDGCRGWGRTESDSGRPCATCDGEGTMLGAAIGAITGIRANINTDRYKVGEMVRVRGFGVGRWAPRSTHKIRGASIGELMPRWRRGEIQRQLRRVPR